MKDCEVQEFRDTLQNYEGKYDIQIAVKHDSLFFVSSITNYHVQAAGDTIVVGSSESAANFQLKIPDLTRIEVLEKDETWRAAAIEASCIGGMKVFMNILTGRAAKKGVNPD
ncbi:hypothetical protein V1498_03235 [Peribacillus sp. SCS-26]|uniref:hypothetical protein n=1 Tax=Paraperibacillus marinus TaxID=3115295 RepID=UPI0039065726